MAKLIQRIGPIHLRARRVPVFQSLVQSIIYQQLSGKAADTIFNRFVALFGDGFSSPAQVLEIQPEKLRAAGLSNPKTKFVASSGWGMSSGWQILSIGGFLHPLTSSRACAFFSSAFTGFGQAEIVL